jgi:thymidylate synthase
MKNIPVLTVEGRTLAEGYERALVALYRGGVPMATQYDRPGDPPSLDATLNLTVLEPWADPMIHKAFPGGIEDLREYVLELSGAKDHWVKNMNDPQDTRWEYTYHGRLAAWGAWRELSGGRPAAAGAYRVDQIRQVVDKLAAQPYSRQAQMITWMPNLDYDCYDPPCLQSLWYRLLYDEQGVGWLNCNVRFRSNDAWGASFMNMFGFLQFNRALIADPLARRTGGRIELGRLTGRPTPTILRPQPGRSPGPPVRPPGFHRLRRAGLRVRRPADSADLRGGRPPGRGQDPGFRRPPAGWTVLSPSP